MTKSELYAAAVERVRALEPGQTVTNVSAGRNNPHRVSVFLGIVRRWVITRPGGFWDTKARCTDGVDVWLTDPISIYPGELSVEKASAIQSELHSILFGPTQRTGD